MKKNKIIVLVLTIILGLFTFYGCKNNQKNPPITPKPDTEDNKTNNQTFTITWKNYDGSILKIEQVKYGKTPKYSGIPNKPSTPEFRYTFSGWDKEVNPASKDTTYVAKFDQAKRKYTITWKNYDGSILKTEQVKYGKTPEYFVIPNKPSTPEFRYTFSGWNKEISPASKDTTYVAKFDKAKRKYTITWKNYDGSILKTERLEYGKIPLFDDEIPNREFNDEFIYKFCGWDKEVETVKETTTYTTKYEIAKNQFTITWKNYDDSVLLSEELKYGVMPNYKSTPEKPQTAATSYTFIGWDKEVRPVKKATTYKAQFKSETRKYDITWKNYDGSILKVDKIAYGSTPKYNGIVPKRPTSDNFNSEFIGWNKEMSTVYGNQEYIATYKKTFTSSYLERMKKLEDMFHFFLINKSSYSIRRNGFYDYGTKLEIPSEYMGEPITSIGDFAFGSCSYLTSITIPNSVTDMGEKVFFENSKISIFCEPTSKPEKWKENWNKTYNDYHYFIQKVYWYSEASNTDGFHWHYVDGKPTIWE